MNDFKVVDFIKNLDHGQLQQVMSNPPPGVPYYLIMGEAQRRQQMMQQAMNQPQQPAPTSTVADDLMSGIAGTPQMSQGSLPPQHPQAAQGIGSFGAPPPPPQQPPMPQAGMPPQGMPPQGMPPQGMPPQGMQRQFASGGEVKDLPNRNSVWSSGRLGEEMMNKRERALQTRKPKEGSLTKKIRDKVESYFTDVIKKEAEAVNSNLKDGANLIIGRDKHVPATIPKERQPDLERAVAMEVENPFAAVTQSPDSAAGLGSIRPSMATPPYVPSSAGGASSGGSGAGGREWKYVRPDVSGLEAPAAPTMPDDADFMSQVQEMFPSGIFDERIGRVDEKLGGMEEERRRAGALALMKAGVTTMAGTSPNGIANIGQGFTAGLDQFMRGEDDVRDRTEKLEERREALQMAKLEYERGNVETAMKWADRARAIEMQVYNVNRDQYDMQMSRAENEAEHANRETAFERGIFTQDRAHGQQERLMSLRENKAATGNTSGNTSMTRLAMSTYQRSLKDAKEMLKFQYFDDPAGLNAAAHDLAMEEMGKFQPELLDHLPIGGSTPAAAPAQTPTYRMDDKGNITR